MQILDCRWAQFGSWHLEAYRGDEADDYANAIKAMRLDVQGPEVISATWDGRDGVISSRFLRPTRALTAPNDWLTLTKQFIGVSEEGFKEGLRLAESTILEWAEGRRASEPH